MILLIGPLNWTIRLRRDLTDRTSHSPHGVILFDEVERLRGTNEHVEILVANTGEPLTYAQQHAIEFAQYHNEVRGAKRPDGKPARISDGMPYWP